MSKTGTLVISLDFELNWGVHDVFTQEQYGENILGAREAIPKILDLFKEYDIHATWATVGMLGFSNKKELLKNLPLSQPSYANNNFSPYGKLKFIGENEVEDPLHFGSSLIRKILEYSNQELATHTFSHYYCLEEGQTIEEFELDLKSSLKIGTLNGRRIQSLVFPRNQTNEDYLQICKKYGISNFRGNENNWIYEASSFHNDPLLKKILRVLDGYLNIFGHQTYPLRTVDMKPIINLPSSLFLRPYNSKLKLLEPLRLRRIKNSMLRAAKKNEVFHLWWHPHNFGIDIDKNIDFLREILKFSAELKREYGFKSLTMGEASTLVLELNENKAFEEIEQKSHEYKQSLG